jgi:diaminopimelate decarboxylase
VTLRDHLTTLENGHLALLGVDLINTCNTYGTPVFVFDKVSLIESFERFCRAFERFYPKMIVCYSIKTNNNLTICHILAAKGAYAEVSSELDLKIALEAGFPGEKIIYDGPFKPKESLREALEHKVMLVNIESFKELEVLNTLANEIGHEQSIGLRVNPFKLPNFIRSLHPNSLSEAAYCFPSCRFGFTSAELPRAFEYVKKTKSLHLECLMMHPYSRALNVLMPVLKEASESFGFNIKYLNIGGGFDPGGTGSTSDDLLRLDYVKRKLGLKSSLDRKQNVSSIESIANTVAGNVRNSLGSFSEPMLITEPGRFIVEPSGMLLLRVDHTKTASGYKWIMVDGGTNILPEIHHRHTILVANRKATSNPELVNVVGPLLYPKDFVAIKVLLPQIEENDIITLLDCGAYSLTSSTQFLYPRPAAVIIDSGGKVEVIREKETVDDVSRKDKPV